MAVVTCPGCGRSVSDKTGECPRCGCTLAYVRPVAKPKAVQKPVRVQIDVYVPIGDGSRDRGEKLYTLYFNDDGIALAYQYNVTESYALSDIVSVDCYKADKPRNNDVASMAAAGLVVGGITGAVVGGILGSADQTSWYFEIVLDRQTKTFRLQSESSRKNIIKWAVYHDLMTSEGVSIPVRRTGRINSTGYETGEQETKLLESYRALLPVFREALQKQADILLTLQSRISRK